ncbi:cytochrome c3 family protein [Ramlibacter alkalitolerans]|nr:cytochrome c3 family protein [Ramlibacter alkalitolerans]
MPSLFLALLALVAVLATGPATADKVSDIANTKHNLSLTGPGTVKATTESQICVFCHTPHQAENIPNAPLWNRKLSSATYDATNTYRSSSIEASLTELAKGPGGLSRLCLSCHDGTMAISSVNVANGKANQTLTLSGAGTGGTMAPGAGVATGYTRNLGTDLTNDHPISFTYDANVALADGELRAPDGAVVGSRVRGTTKPKLPLEGGQMQCTTCHDPHLRETDPLKGAAKFLRVNRFQELSPTGGAFSEANDIVCLACHDKAGQAWALSAHANPTVADETFNATATAEREFPANLPVWRAACLSCHDTHTVQGARRLLREGTDSIARPKSGGNSAIEETCYQCHSSTAETVLQANTQVPNIKDDFNLPIHMPIKSTQQRAGTEVHDIGTGSGAQRGKDFYEDPALLGKGAGNENNRHVECTDCHNPHRVIKNRLFNDNPATPTAGTHNHASGHTNIASGVLKGSYGVEPVYGAVPFNSPASSFDVKRGVGGVGASTAAGSAWVTREYQVCLKCHSTYAYTTPPLLSQGAGGGTASSTNGLLQFTDQAMEFQPPATHKGELTTTDSGSASGFTTNNHRSWHPVVDNTGRTNAIRTTTTGSWVAPWNGTNDTGTQTMYCTDCHGSNTAAGTVVPNAGSPWGPHGSTNNFLLKGSWDTASGSGQANTLCFKCHDANTYSTKNGGGGTGFTGGGKGNLHAFHTDKLGKIRCGWCHVAVPHGWKNKALLVNLNDVGAEAGLATGTQVRTNTTAAYTKAPYYNNAVLKVRTFARSGNWSDTNCGSAGAPGNGQSGRSWMRDSSENCVNAP